MARLIKSVIGEALILSVLATPALACSSCGCALTSDWLSQGLVAQPGTTFDLRYDYVPQTQLRTSTGAVDHSKITFPADREIERYTYNNYLTATLDRQISPLWGVDLQAPFLLRPHATTAPGDTEQSFSRTNGLGDVRLTGRWQGIGGPGITGLQFGLKLPTGGFHRDFRSGPQQDSPVDRGLQVGTGTTDAIVGAYHFGKLIHNVDFVLQAQAQIPLNGRDLYRPGLAGNLSAGFHYTHWRGITPQIQLNLRIAEKDHGLNSDRLNSGGELVYVAPGFIARASHRAAVFAYVQLPLYERVSGFQLAPRYTASIGLHYRL